MTSLAFLFLALGHDLPLQMTAGLAANDDLVICSDATASIPWITNS